jgi:hypothetical protein
MSNPFGAAERPLVVLFRIGFFAACAMALYAALTPPSAHPLQLFGWDKANHLIAFAVLLALGALGFPRAPLPVLGVAMILYGGAIELLQGLPGVGRDSDPIDLLADGAGAFLAAGPAFLLRLGLYRLGRRHDRAVRKC